jgi:hypothetical protein
VSCRLDYFLVEEELLETDPSMEGLILPKVGSIGSDHWPISFYMDTGATPKYKPFQFDKFWLAHPDFHELPKYWWARQR